MSYLSAPSISSHSTTATASPNPASTARQIVFIDSSVDEAQQLALKTLPGIDAILLNPTQDGIEQISTALAGRSDISGIHLIGHGSSGSLQLGSTVLNQDTIAQYADSLNQWKTALTEDADLLLYGCNVASDFAGQSFVDRLSQLTAADVAASDDLTGNAALGGDWLLEYTTGLIEAPLALQAETMQAYQQVFADFQVSNAAQLVNAINGANASQASDRIFITGRIDLTNTLPAINSDIELIGSGEGAIINGSPGANRLFKVTKGNVSFNNLTLQNGIAQGSTGVNGGGGGLGAGGALFVQDANVIINNVRFLNNRAQGGNATGNAGRGGNGGNLGSGGSNGASGGKGGGFDGSAGGAGGAPGLVGNLGDTNPDGGIGGFGRNGGFGEGGGGGGGGSGGQSIFFLFGDTPGRGGSGGAGGIGGFGGGTGGSGGGGGGADSTGVSAPGGSSIVLPSADFFIASGGRGANGAPGGADADIFGGAGGQGGRGGGGAGLGGAIFARSSTVNVFNSVFQNNSVIAGSGANSGVAQADSIFSLDSAIGLQNNQLGTTGQSGNGRFTNIVLPTASIASVSSVQEGSNFAFTILLSNPSLIDLTLNFQIGGSAIAAGNANADHSFQTGSVVIPRGQSSVTLNGTIADDILPELTETLTLKLLPGTGYQPAFIGSNASVQIIDTDLTVIRGLEGDESLTGTAGIEQISGNAGNDTIDGNGGNDFLFGDAGNDLIIWDSGDGSDLVDGGLGTDTLVFNCSNQGDRLIVQEVPDNTLQLLRNQPTAIDLRATSIERLEINCLNGSDGVEIRRTTNTGVSSIRVTGGGGSDSINGAAATADLELLGNSGNDTLAGGSRNDTLIGGGGNDLLVGNFGADVFTGGNGVDTFSLRLGDPFTASLTNFDRITDLQIGTDIIDAPTAVDAANITQLGAVASLEAGAIANLLSATNFGANGAATFSFGDRAFLALNDGRAGFAAGPDVIVEITGFSGELNNLQVV